MHEGVGRKAIELRVNSDEAMRVGRERQPARPLNGGVRVDFPASSDGEVMRELAERLIERNRQLETALTTRVVIEQAKGVLAERFELDPEDAFEVLRRAARNNRMKIQVLADQVVRSRVTPAPIREVVAT